MRLKVYFDKVCDKHPELEGERFTASRACVECLRLYGQKRHYAQKDYENKRSRDWHANNVEYNKKRCRDRYFENREHEIATRRERHKRRKNGQVAE